MFGCSFDASRLKMLTTKRRDVKVVEGSECCAGGSK